MSEHQQQPSLAIIIVNWNSYDITAPCLESLKSLSYKNHKIIVVDNGSDDDSIDQFENNHPEVILLKNSSNLGFTGGNNTGIEYAMKNGMELLMLLNNDTIVTNDFASILVNSLMSDESIGAIQPKIMYNQERDVIWNAGGKFNPFLFLSSTIGLDKIDRGQYNKGHKTDWITGCCFLVRSKVIQKIGLLDQRFFIYYEDNDWSFKIKNLGYVLFYEPSAVIYHEAGMSNRNRQGHNEGNISPFTRYHGIRNHIFMIRRYSKGLNLVGAWSYQFFKILIYLLYFIIRRRPLKFKAVINGVKDGLSTRLN